MTTCTMPDKIIELYKAYDRLSYDCFCSLIDLSDITGLCTNNGNWFSYVKMVHNAGVDAISECLHRDATSITSPQYPGPVPDCWDTTYIDNLIYFFNNISCDRYESLGLCDLSTGDPVDEINTPPYSTSARIWADCGRYFLPGTYTISYLRGALLWKADPITSSSCGDKYWVGGQRPSDTVSGGLYLIVQPKGGTEVVYDLLSLAPGITAPPFTSYEDLFTYYVNRSQFVFLTQHSKIGLLVVGAQDLVLNPGLAMRRIGNVCKYLDEYPFTVTISPCYCGEVGLHEVVEGVVTKRFCTNFCTEGYPNGENCWNENLVAPIVYDWTFPNPTAVLSWASGRGNNSTSCWNTLSFSVRESTNYSHGGPCAPEPYNRHSPLCDIEWYSYYDVLGTGCTEMMANPVIRQSGVFNNLGPDTVITWTLSSLPMGKRYCIYMEHTWTIRDTSVCDYNDILNPATRSVTWINCANPACPPDYVSRAEVYFTSASGASIYNNINTCLNMGSIGFYDAYQDFSRSVTFKYIYADFARIQGSYSRIGIDGVIYGYGAVIPLIFDTAYRSKTVTLYFDRITPCPSSQYPCDSNLCGYNFWMQVWSTCGLSNYNIHYRDSSCVRYTTLGRSGLILQCPDNQIVRTCACSRSGPSAGLYTFYPCIRTVSPIIACVNLKKSGGCCDSWQFDGYGMWDIRGTDTAGAFEYPIVSGEIRRYNLINLPSSVKSRYKFATMRIYC